MKPLNETWAIDVDGTIIVERDDIPFPRISRELVMGAKETMIYIHDIMKDTIVLHTCREGSALDIALEFIDENGIPYDYVNDNTRDTKERIGIDCRKVFAHHYVDNRARPYELNWKAVRDYAEKRFTERVNE